MVSFKKALVFALAIAASTAGAADYKAGEVIVKYRDGAVRTRSEMNFMYNRLGARHVRRYAGIMRGFEHLVLKDGIKVQDAIAELQKDPTVEYAQPNYMLYALPVQNEEPAPTPSIPCIPGMEIPGCDPNGGGGGGLPGGGIPCIPGFEIPGCDPNGGGGGIPGLPPPGGGDGGKIPCLIPGLPFPPGCDDSGVPSDPSEPPSNPTNPPAKKPALQPAPAETIPAIDDPSNSQAYGLEKVGAIEAWKEWKGSKDFLVAVIDTGVDYNHEDLAFNLWRNPNPSDKNDIVGFDFVHNDGLPYDDNQHGTHTAGTVGAVGGNGKGISGVAQRVSIMSLKFLSGEGSGTSADAIRAIDYAVAHGARVLSNSWGGKGDDGFNKALQESIERAKEKDVLFVAAAGNDGTNNDKDPAYPASFDSDNIIAVAATDKSDKLAFFSNYGTKTTHVAAPGASVYSTVPGNKYASHSGTSMACPHVAGAAALVWSKNPTWTYKQVKKALMETADKLPALAGKVASGGRINVLKALHATE